MAGCFIASLGAVAAAAADWQELGPAPVANVQYAGRVSAVVASPANANRYYAAGADGGVWRSDDAGVSWTPLTDHLPTTAIGALALDPANENVIYAGTGEAHYANHSRFGLGLYRSTDAGASWQHLGEADFAGRCISTIVVSPADSNVVYAAVARAGGFPELAAAKGHPQGNGPVGVFRSLDRGETWTQLVQGLPNLAATDLVIDPTQPGVLYAAIGHIFGDTDNGIYRTADGGDSWTKLTTGLPVDVVGRISLALAPTQPARLVALLTRPADAFGGGASTRGVYLSDNAGATWSLLPFPADLQATYGWYLSVVHFSPTDSNTVFVGGLNLLRYDLVAPTFTIVTPPHVDVHALAFDAAGRLLCGNDGGVHRSADLGNSWIARNNRLGTTQFYAGVSPHPLDTGGYLGGLQDNGTVRRRSDTGLWSQIFGGDGGWTQIDANNPARFFLCFQGTGNLYRTLDDGGMINSAASGIVDTDRNCFHPPFLIDPVVSNRMLYGTQRVYRSLTGANAWSLLSGDLTGGTGAIQALAIAPSNTNVTYAATNDGRVLRSDNGGGQFQTVATDVPGWPRVTREIIVHPHEPLTVYLAVGAFNVDQVRRSRDGGANWESLDGDLPDMPVNVLAIDARAPLAMLYAGAEAGVYRSIDDGRTWRRFGAGLPNACVVDLVLEPARARLTAATQGRGLWSVAIDLPGDLNGDGIVDNFDIDAFVLALVDPVAFATQYPNVDPIAAGDFDGDGALTNFDIAGFARVLVG
ncbi:MAG: hypothetical protein AB7Q17_10110 [Phycisphaerae bacterium]